MFLVIEWFSLSRGDKQIFRNQSRDIRLKSCITFPQTYIFLYHTSKLKHKWFWHEAKIIDATAAADAETNWKHKSHPIPGWLK